MEIKMDWNPATILYTPTADVSKSLEDAQQLYTREYTKYKDMFGCFKSMLSQYEDPESMYLYAVLDLQNFILALHVQSEEVSQRKTDIMFWRTRKRMEENKAKAMEKKNEQP